MTVCTSIDTSPWMKQGGYGALNFHDDDDDDDDDDGGGFEIKELSSFLSLFPSFFLSLFFLLLLCSQVILCR